jgi:PTH2 family peptidyl-tRNA hydrolase
MCSSKKIALRGETTEELVELATKADEAGLPNTSIRDAGLTEIPGGSLTVLGIFGASNNVDKVTGRLKLL